MATVTDDAEPDVREAAVYALGAQGATAASPLEMLVTHQDVNTRDAVVHTLARLGPAGVPGLRQGLHDPDWRIRLAAVNALGDLGIRAVEAVPELALLRQDSTRMVRERAYGALARIGPSLDSLRTLLASPDTAVRAKAVGKLARYGTPTLPLLIGATEDPVPRIRSLATSELGSYGPPAIPALLARLKDTDPSVRGRAALEFADDAMGSAVSAHIVAIRRVAADRDRLAAGPAQAALKRLAARGIGQGTPAGNTPRSP